MPAARLSWLICDASDRWRRTAHRFLSAADIPWQSVAPHEGQALASQNPQTVLFWGLDLDSGPEKLELLWILHRLPRPPLQIVGLPATVRNKAPGLNQVLWPLRQLGAAMILSAPEEFPLALRLGIAFENKANSVEKNASYRPTNPNPILAPDS